PTVILVFDRLGDELFAVAPVWPSDRAPEASLEVAQERIDDAFRALAAPAPEPVRAGPDMPMPQPTPVMAPGRYGEMVERAKQYIEAGDIFQVVLAQRFTAPFTLPPLSLYRSLRRVNPSPFLYFLDLPGFAVVGSSPEILVRVRAKEDGAREVTIRPIAGTRPRGKTPAEDKANEISLLGDQKERAEHLMLLDLGRNDVGRVAAKGTVKVTESYTIERYSHVMHIVSNVVGDLDTNRADAIDAVFAGFPAGTVSGAPKVRACEIIAGLESETRGAYAGGVGYFGPDGNLDSCIVLRTGILKDGVLHVQAGAGIVADSDPVSEQRECEHKSGALFAAAREAVRVAQEAGFTWNLVHYIMELGAQVEVVRNDALTAAQAIETGAAGFLLSPGPCTPNEAGISLDLVGAAADAGKPLLGVCLGHQSIGQYFGGTVQRGGLMHGKTSPVTHDNTGLFEGIPSPFIATRYHSLIVTDIPACLHPADPRGAVPPRKHRHAAWPCDAGQLPETLRDRRPPAGMNGLPDVSEQPFGEAEAESLFGAILDREVSDEAIAAFLVALSQRGETSSEIAGAARAMRARMIAIKAPEGAIDVCGTGGDGHHTLNVSTAVSLVVAACGVPL
ncbi:hypothetical protein E4T56_gene7817, partial [Termitomyces sp. T112]